MLELIVQNMSIVWLALMVLLLIIEAATAGLTCIWFALGALAALIAALFGAQIWLQALWFLAVSLLSLWLTRPLALKYLNSRKVATNADRVVGAEGVVTEAIDNIAGTGAVKLDGKEWTARSESGMGTVSYTHLDVYKRQEQHQPHGYRQRAYVALAVAEGQTQKQHADKLLAVLRAVHEAHCRRARYLRPLEEALRPSPVGPVKN